MIEHPEWTSRQVYESKEIYDGKDLGRIYRVTPAEGQTPPIPRLRLSQASDEELVSYLVSVTKPLERPRFRPSG